MKTECSVGAGCGRLCGGVPAAPAEFPKMPDAPGPSSSDVSDRPPRAPTPPSLLPLQNAMASRAALSRFAPALSNLRAPAASLAARRVALTRGYATEQQQHTVRARVRRRGHPT
jgi:hypothetical protein